MAMQEPLRLGIQSHDVMHALLSPLHSANTIVQSKAALTVAATACDAEARTEVSVCITFLLSSGRLLPLHSFETFSSVSPTHRLSPSRCKMLGNELTSSSQESE